MLCDLNFRDIGGIPVRGGKIRRGLVYRSEGPAGFSAAHHSELADLGICAVCDLRSAAEHTNAPHVWPHGTRLLNFDVNADLRAAIDANWTVLIANPTAEGARQSMIHTYRVIASSLQPFLSRFVDVLSGDETPVLVHCAAGKDRTGVLIALLLQLLGAAHADILRDYLLSECFARKPEKSDQMAALFEARLGYRPDPSMMQVILGVEAVYIEAALAAVMEKWGSVAAYFAASGVEEARQAALSKALVEA
jgi:protein-tyrosine phosphatase